MNRRPKLQIVAPDATPEEAAAVAAALEQFMRETAPVRVDMASRQPPSAWMRAGRQEGVSRWSHGLMFPMTPGDTHGLW